MLSRNLAKFNEERDRISLSLDVIIFSEISQRQLIQNMDKSFHLKYFEVEKNVFDSDAPLVV